MRQSRRASGGGSCEKEGSEDPTCDRRNWGSWTLYLGHAAHKKGKEWHLLMKRSSSSSPALKAIEKYVVGGGSAGGATIQRLRREGPTETTITRTANGLQQRRWRQGAELRQLQEVSQVWAAGSDQDHKWVTVMRSSCRDGSGQEDHAKGNGAAK
jgi:hypothetical protein